MGVNPQILLSIVQKSEHRKTKYARVGFLGHLETDMVENEKLTLQTWNGENES